MKTLLLTPPLVQLNTPYPAVPYLTGFLRRRGHEVVQADLGLEWALRIFSSPGLQQLVAVLEQAPHATQKQPAVAHLLADAATFMACADLVPAFLQGRDRGIAHRIASRTLLPEGPRFAGLGPTGHEEDYLNWAFGSLGIQDKARYFCTLFLEDWADAISQGIDPHFGFGAYGERMTPSPSTIDPLLAQLDADTFTAQTLHDLTAEWLARESPDVVGISLPFPGTVLAALRIGKRIRELGPKTHIVWGGGWVNTELRQVSDPRLFDYVDALVFDDGERPFECLLEHFAGERPRQRLLRTRMREAGEVRWYSDDDERDVPMSATAWPTYVGLPLDNYLSLIDQPNPMQQLWSDTRWNKLTVAHGCYWKKCTFCDISLDYIGRYEPLSAAALVDRIEALIEETGSRGFHFVDEAAPPKRLKEIAEELIERRVAISWWGNVRFDTYFTPEVCELLAASGCIAITGGLEAANDRLLELMKKGVTVEQVARVTHAFSAAGILVHAYLIYGFPTQTVQETVDSLEYVRQLFEAGCFDSAYWHRLAVTAHAPLGLKPEEFGIKLALRSAPTFANNDLEFTDPTGVDHDALGRGLHKAVYNYIRGLGLEDDVRAWFDVEVPPTAVPADFVRTVMATEL